MTPTRYTALDGMVERVAKAIVEACSGPWELISPQGKAAALHEARAAIEAMRELTEADINACRMEPTPRDLMYWNAMIDAVLTESKPQ